MNSEFARTDMYDEYERLRTEGQIVRDGEGIWHVLGHSECQAALRDSRLSHNLRRELVPDEDWPEIVRTLGGERALVLLPEEEHRPLHRAMAQRLAKRMERYRVERITPVIDRFLAEFARGEGGDYVSAFADPVPSAVIASVLGLPWDDRSVVDRWKELNDALARTREGFDITDEQHSAAAVAGDELDEVVRPVIRARKDAPQDDFISELWDFVPSILADCTEDDIVAQCRQIFLGGSESTAHLLANVGLLLFSHPELWREVGDEPALAEKVVEEALRVMGVNQARPRVALENVTLADAEIKAGDRLLVVVGAANRDPARYENPFGIDVRADGRAHIAFGVGAHACPGAGLARVEARQVVRALVSRWEEPPTLDPEQAPPRFTGVGMTSWRPVHVRFPAG